MSPPGAGIVQLLAAYGPLGLIIGFLMWRDWRKDVAQEKLDAAKSVERAKLEEKRMAYDRERLETDKAIAGSLASLTAVIQGLRR